MPVTVAVIGPMSPPNRLRIVTGNWVVWPTAALTAIAFCAGAWGGTSENDLDWTQAGAFVLWRVVSTLGFGQSLTR